MTIITNLLKIIAIILLSVNGLFVYFIIIITLAWLEEDIEIVTYASFLLGIIFRLNLTLFFLYYICNVIVTGEIYTICIHLNYFS